MYWAPPAVKLMSLPRILPLAICVDPSEPDSIWNSCLSVSSPCGRRHVPATFAGTIQRSAVHQLEQSPPTVAVSSGVHSSIVNVFDTMRVPGLRSRIFGRSLRLICGSRNIVITVACEKSLSKRSAFAKVALSPAPAATALRRESSTISGLYSMPSARAPRLAAVITVRPSPEPRSMT